MKPVGRHLIRNHGFSLAELMVVIGMIGVFAVVAMPVFANFLQAQRTRGAAQELVTLLNQARQLAISTNSRYRVAITAGTSTLCFQQSTDGGATWSGCLPGPGTDSAGVRTLDQVSMPTTNLTGNNASFNHLGTGNAGRIKVQDISGGPSLDVVINSAGQITIQASTL